MIAPEGRPFVAIGVVVLLALTALGWTAGGSWILPALLWLPIAAWVPWFFRDPYRPGPRGPTVVIAPADGKVVSIMEVEDADYPHGGTIRISIFMNVFDVHVNRYPVDGVLERREYRPGKFVNATLDKASTDNERMSLAIRTTRGHVLVRQIAGLIARRIVADHQPGEAVVQGERLGIIRFGSRVDTFLDLAAQPVVTVGERVRAGQTVIAKWPA